jgi:hypothetical protein
MGAGIAVWGLWIGLQPLSDNSFLTHLATGRLIVDEGIPRHDPFTFTAPGVDWVVQSWLMSTVYGLVDEWWGGHGLLFLNAAFTTALAVFAFRLTRPAGGVVARLGLSALAVAIGTAAWSERPLLAGLVLMGVVILAADRSLHPAWLLPAMWLWVNAHGSFPLGLVLLAALALGRRLDGERPVVELRALAWATAGTVLGAVSPLGPELLLFPLDLLSRQDVLRNISEWQAPRFTEAAERLFLLQLALSVIALVRTPSYRVALPLVVFGIAALVAARNIGVASLVLLPGAAVGLAGLGTIEGERRAPVFSLAAAALAALGALMVAGARQDRAFSVAAYPTGALGWAASEGLVGSETRTAAPDFVGNYLEAVALGERVVFIDDRYDMFPEALTDDYLALLRARPDWEDVLTRHDIDVLVWEHRAPLAAAIRADDDWHIAWADARWIVALRRER